MKFLVSHKQAYGVLQKWCIWISKVSKWLQGSRENSLNSLTILFFYSFFPIMFSLLVITLNDVNSPREKDIALFLFRRDFNFTFQWLLFFSVHLLPFSSVVIVLAVIGDIFKANETSWKQFFFYRLHNITDHYMSLKEELICSFRLEIAISRSFDAEVRLIGIRQEAKVRIWVD